MNPAYCQPNKMKHSISLILLLLASSIQAAMPRRKLNPIIWTVQNKMFDTTNDNADLMGASSQKAVVDVQIGEFLNIICPMYDFNDNTYKNVEYHTLYMVSKDEYDTCQIKKTSTPVREILRCDKPFENIKYTFYISKFSPVPGAIEFTPGSDYYFISTSNGTLNGLNNTVGGTCQKDNMKMIIRVLASIKNTKKIHNPPQIRNYQIEHDASTTTARATSTSTTTSTTSTTSAATSTLLGLISKALKITQSEQKSPKSITYIEMPYMAAESTTLANDIFILEPDDYSDIISQFISSNSSDYYYGDRNSISYYEKLTPSSAASALETYRLLLRLTLINLMFLSTYL